MRAGERLIWASTALFWVACGGRALSEGPVSEAGGGRSIDPPDAGSPTLFDPPPSSYAGGQAYGGAQGYAGAPAFGGATNFAGAPAYGGAIAYAGAPALGGAPAYGGAPNFGGAPAHGGAPAYGGAPINSDSVWEVQQLARLRRGVVGTWKGSVKNPWAPETCPTTLTFTSDGHYSAHSPGDSCVVFYYGTNDDSPEKTYRLVDVNAAAEGSGTIDFFFAPGNINEGELNAVWLSDDESQLSFRAYKDNYGPLVFTMKRVK